MIVIRYVDICKSEQNQDGSFTETVLVKNTTIPIIIDPLRINTIQPYFSPNGKIYKNVSYINYDGEMYKVVGNYKEINNYKDNFSFNNLKKIEGFNGFRKQEKKETK